MRNIDIIHILMWPVCVLGGVVSWGVTIAIQGIYETNLSPAHSLLLSIIIALGGSLLVIVSVIQAIQTARETPGVENT